MRELTKFLNFADISIWLNQSVKGIRDKFGNSAHNAHLIGLFNRLCKLLYFKIKPVFVFDGQAPYLKRQTLDERRKRRLKGVEQSQKAVNKVLMGYLKTQVDEPLDSEVIESLVCDNLLSTFLPRARTDDVDEDMFHLKRPDSPNSPKPSSSKTTVEPPRRFHDEREYFSEVVASKLKEYQDVDELDVNSVDFKAMPAEIRHELLSQVKEDRKERRQEKSLPKESNTFSSYQMSRLLHKRNLQRHIESTIEEINERQDSSQSSNDHGRVASEAETHFVYQRGVTKLPSQKDLKFQRFRPKKPKTSSSNGVVGYTDIYGSASDFDYGKSAAAAADGSSLMAREGKFDRSSKTSDDKPESVLSHVFDCNVKTSSTDVFDVDDVCSAPTNISEPNNLPDLDEEDDDIITGIMSDSDTSSESSSQEKVDSSIDIGKLIRAEEKHASTPKKRAISIVIESSDDERESTDAISETNLNPFTPSQESVDQVERSETPTLTLEKNGSSSPDLVMLEETNIDFKSATNSSKSNSDASCPPSESQSVYKSPSKPPSQAARQTPRKSPSGLSRQDLLQLREANKQERYAETVSERMEYECKELLKLFGIPFIVSPTEAESQCAALEQLGLTQGTITDDSDIWLFGGTIVYKNFFTQSKFVEVYRASEIEAHYKLSRDAMICLALLTGSDYTPGVEGVGPVKAIEILSEFPGSGLEPLKSFKRWWDSKRSRQGDKSPGNKIRAQLLKIKLDESFPNAIVFDTYVKPTVDESPEKFSWARPDLDLLRSYARDKLAWSQSKLDDQLLPVLKKLNETRAQSRIDHFFKPAPKKCAPVASKRLAKALGIAAEAGPSAQGSTLKERVKNQRRAPNRARQEKEKKQTVVTENVVGERAKQTKSRLTANNVKKGPPPKKRAPKTKPTPAASTSTNTGMRKEAKEACETTILLLSETSSDSDSF